MLQKILLNLPSELAHNIAIFGIKNGFAGKQSFEADERLKVNLWGNSFAHPLGLSAGFDKNAECINQLCDLGFSFVEAGTVTLLPQFGNPRPRIFRLKKDNAIINRLGFNNKGVEYALQNAREARKKNADSTFGINIGPNKHSKNRIEDYVRLIEYFYDACNYITINISSPNTIHLRDMQRPMHLKNLLQAIENIDNEMQKKCGGKVPILIKLSPDVEYEEYNEAIETILRYQSINGLIISNTSIHNRSNLQSKYKYESGGLSGKPLFDPSTKILQHVYKITEGKLPIIGVGGIFSAEDAYNKIISGASLLQIYSGFIYKGPKIIKNIIDGLSTIMSDKGINSIQDIVGFQSH